MKRRIISVDKINRMAGIDPMALVLKSEAHYKNQLSAVSEQVSALADQHKIVLIAGPSASGKTTTSLKLRRNIYERGVKSVTISLDDFFKDRDDLPRMPDGTPDFESVYGLDLDAVRECFSELIKGNAAKVPRFDFKTGKRSGYQTLRISGKHIVIVEGIHALNPVLTGDLSNDKFFKIYTSVRTRFAKDNTVVMTGRQLRLVRRLIRDYFYRGSGPENTLDMWKNVVAAEEVNIMPFMPSSDFIIDTLHAYEPMVYQHYFRGLCDMVVPSSGYAAQMNEIESKLSLFCELGRDAVPETSMLREFIN